MIKHTKPYMCNVFSYHMVICTMPELDSTGRLTIQSYKVLCKMYLVMNKRMSLVCLKGICGLDNEVKLCVHPRDRANSNKTAMIVMLVCMIVMADKLHGTKKITFLEV